MKTKILALGALSFLTLTAPAFAAGTAAPAAPSAASASASSSARTPMTPQQTRALWTAAQTKLKSDSLYNGPINGQRNDATVQAIRTFQSRNNLPQSGRLDSATRKALGI